MVMNLVCWSTSYRTIVDKRLFGYLGASACLPTTKYSDFFDSGSVRLDSLFGVIPWVNLLNRATLAPLTTTPGLLNFVRSSPTELQEVCEARFSLKEVPHCMRSRTFLGDLSAFALASV